MPLMILQLYQVSLGLNAFLHRFRLDMVLSLVSSQTEEGEWIDQKVQCALVTWPVSASETGVDLALKKPSLLFSCK